MLTKEQARLIVNIHDLLPTGYFLGKVFDFWTIYDLKQGTGWRITGTLEEVYIWAKKSFNEDELPFE